jgi:hypothetical protein
MVVLWRLLGDDWGSRHLHALGDIVGPIRYASLRGHMPLIGLWRVVVFGHVWWVEWRERGRLKEISKSWYIYIYIPWEGVVYMRSRNGG